MILVSFMLVVYNLVYFREPYHTREFDSANRLVLQALPSVLLYLSLRFAQISSSQHSQGFVANFAQEVMKGQWPLSVAGIRRPGRRTIQPQ
jgi:hypothetical protein